MIPRHPIQQHQDREPEREFDGACAQYAATCVLDEQPHGEEQPRPVGLSQQYLQHLSECGSPARHARHVAIDTVEDLVHAAQPRDGTQNAPGPPRATRLPTMATDEATPDSRLTPTGDTPSRTNAGVIQNETGRKIRSAGSSPLHSSQRFCLRCRSAAPRPP